MVDMPYFMTNKKWYRFDYKQKKFVLTDAAPKEAQKSYDDYMREVKKENYGKG